jgi:hypothetical protein
VLLPAPLRELHEVVEREHTRELGEAVFAPDDERNLVAHRDLERQRLDARVVVPREIADLAHHVPRDLAHRLRVGRDPDEVAAEALHEIREVADAERGVEAVVERHQQRIQPVHDLDEVRLVVAVLAAADRDDAVVLLARRPRARFELLQKVAEHPLARLPVDLQSRLVVAAAATDAVVVEDDGGLGVRRVEAPRAVIHLRPSFRASGHRCPPAACDPSPAAC